MAVVSKAKAEPMEEDGEEEEDKEADMGEGSSTEDLVPKHALVPCITMPVATRFWEVGPNDQVSRRGTVTS